MSFLRLFSSKPLLALVAPALVVAIALPCVPCGGSSPVTLPRPSLPSAPSGAPGSSSWSTDDPPRAEEHDDITPNDPMGPATEDASTNTGSVEVTNDHGDLKGPNGNDQNGGGEGECIEVAICWFYWTWTLVTDYVPTETGWETHTYWQHVRKKVCNGGNDVEVCPCTPCP